MDGSDQALGDHFAAGPSEIASCIQSGGQIFVKRTDVIVRNQDAGQLKPRFYHGCTEQSVRYDFRLELELLSAVCSD